MTYRIEQKAADGHWFILGEERGCTQAWAEHIANDYRRLLLASTRLASLFPEAEIRIVKVGEG